MEARYIKVSSRYTEGIQLLADAIVTQAAKDLRLAYKALERVKDKDPAKLSAGQRYRCNSALQEKGECESFFLSDRLYLYCNLDGKEIVDKIYVMAMAEVREEKKKNDKRGRTNKTKAGK